MPLPNNRTVRTAIVAVVVAASALLGGLGAGIALSAVFGSDDPNVPTLTNPVAASDPGIQVESVPNDLPTETPTVASDPVPLGVSVRSATIVPPSTETGRQRERLSLRLRVVVVNRGKSTVQLDQLRLDSGPVSVSADLRAVAAAAGLLKPLPAGKSASGELRFETSGEQSRRFTDGSSAVLRVNGQTTRVRFVLGAPDA